MQVSWLLNQRHPTKNLAGMTGPIGSLEPAVAEIQDISPGYFHVSVSIKIVESDLLFIIF